MLKEIARPFPRASDLEGLRWELRMCLTSCLPDTAGLGNHTLRTNSANEDRQETQSSAFFFFFFLHFPNLG